MSDTVILGEVTCPSGELVVIDAGYLGLWSGERSPADVRSGFATSPGTDLEIVGPDAEAAARSFDRQAGVTCYDIPDHGLAEFTALFDQHCRDKGLTARMQPMIGRVPHRERVRRCVRRGGEEFIVFGAPAVAVGGLPTGRPLPVVALRTDFGPPIGENWHSFRIPFTAKPVAERRLLGHIVVDHARVIFADADALSSWQHEWPSDGLADVAFWGRDADDAARAHGVGLLGRAGEEGVYGWPDLPVEQARRRAIAIGEWQQADARRRLAVDFRPHSDHFQLMAQFRASTVEAATVTVGGSRLVGAMTGYGDGLFQVHLEIGEDGAPAGLQLLFAYPEQMDKFAEFRRRYG